MKKKNEKIDGSNQYYIYKCLLNLLSDCYRSDMIDLILYNTAHNNCNLWSGKPSAALLGLIFTCDETKDISPTKHCISAKIGLYWTEFIREKCYFLRIEQRNQIIGRNFPT